MLAYAADNILTFAAATALGPAILTAGFTIDYVRPAHGKLLRARAKRRSGEQIPRHLPV